MLQVVRDVQRGPLVKLEKGVSFFLVQERTFPLALFVEWMVKQSVERTVYITFNFFVWFYIFCWKIKFFWDSYWSRKWMILTTLYMKLINNTQKLKNVFGSVTFSSNRIMRGLHIGIRWAADKSKILWLKSALKLSQSCVWDYPTFYRAQRVLVTTAYDRVLQFYQ